MTSFSNNRATSMPTPSAETLARVVTRTAPINENTKGPTGGSANIEPSERHQYQKQHTHSWDHPDWSILDDRRGQLPDFPLDTLTPAWRHWTERAAHGAGVTPGHVAVPVIGATSSLVGTARRVRASRSWSEPMTLLDVHRGCFRRSKDACPSGYAARS